MHGLVDQQSAQKNIFHLLEKQNIKTCPYMATNVYKILIIFTSLNQYLLAWGIRIVADSAAWIDVELKGIRFLAFINQNVLESTE